MLVLTRKKKQSLMLGDNIEIQVLEIQGDQVRLGIVAPAALKVLRKEIYVDVHAANREAAVWNPTALKKMKNAAQENPEKMRMK